MYINLLYVQLRACVRACVHMYWFYFNIFLM